MILCIPGHDTNISLWSFICPVILPTWYYGPPYARSYYQSVIMILCMPSHIIPTCHYDPVYARLYHQPVIMILSIPGHITNLSLWSSEYPVILPTCHYDPPYARSYYQPVIMILHMAGHITNLSLWSSIWPVILPKSISSQSNQSGSSILVTSIIGTRSK